MTFDHNNLRAAFATLYGRTPRLFRAPGRVNLIGEHTDYNGGFVLPMAIDYETQVAAATRPDRKIRVRSLNINEEFEFDLDAPAQKLRGSWRDYVEGVARILARQNVRLRGADVLLYSDVPHGAGLSSSAALEMSVGLALSEISGQTVDKVQLALAGQAAEHEFVGAKVGIMDQFVSALGQAGNALLIDCRHLRAEQVPCGFAAAETALIICDSRVQHALAASEYNTRRAECETGVRLLQQFLPAITQLRDVSERDFGLYQDHLPEIIKRRCRHIITENARTLNAAQALRHNDLVKFGALMQQSHQSMRDDFVISCAEIDLLVDIAHSCAGVLGARMTGGGFGGSTVNLVKRNNLAEFTEKVSRTYFQETGIHPRIYPARPSDGASEISEK